MTAQSDLRGVQAAYPLRLRKLGQSGLRFGVGQDGHPQLFDETTFACQRYQALDDPLNLPKTKKAVAALTRDIMMLQAHGITRAYRR